MLKKNAKSFTQKVGEIPGSLTYTGKKKGEKAAIRLIQYDEEKVYINEELDYNDIINSIKDDTLNWIHFFTLDQKEAIEKIGGHFNIHELLLEDTLNVEHLPKVEFSESHIFFTLKILGFDSDGNLEEEHVNFIFGSNYLISLKEKRGKLFNPVKERILKNIGKVRKRQVDYLFYLLVDSIVDNYYVMLEKLREKFEELEDTLIEHSGENYINEIHVIKRQVLTIRKYIFVLREEISNLISEEPEQISESNYKYLRDIQDHVNFVYESIETFREDQKSLLELNNSNMNNRMNQVMKTLTIVATIFIPLTFIVGIYGMNFQFMPELNWKWGYFSILGLMAFVSIIMIWFMKRKKWL